MELLVNRIAKRETYTIGRVPNFMGVSIHSGNLPKDTRGCILVGENRKVGRLYDSLFWLRHVINFICDARDVWITVRYQRYFLNNFAILCSFQKKWDW